MAITGLTHRIAAQQDERRHEALERRRVQIGGMLELARRLDEWRLARLLEQHMDALTRLIQAD